MGQRISKAAVGLIAALCFPASINCQRTSQYSSFPDNKGFYVEAIKKVAQKKWPQTKGQRIPCGIVTHHFLASNIIVQYFQGVAASSSPKKIFIIGPDHFLHGTQNISLSDLPWQTPFGVLETDKKDVAALTQALNLTQDHEAFSNEHSIGILVPFVKYFFPNAKIVPILLRRGIGAKNLETLYQTLSNLSDKETHILLSSDFSHGKTSNEAIKEDVKSQNAIMKKEYDKVWDLDDDCRPGLYLILKLAGNASPLLVAHTNSAQIAKKEISNCTSYFTVFFLTKKN